MQHNRRAWLGNLGALSAILAIALMFPAAAQVPATWTPLDPALQPKFTSPLPVPVDYTPDTSTFPGFDYYEIQVAPVTHPPVAFPQPPQGSDPIPAGSQWLGLVNPATGKAMYTPVWGYGQLNGGPLGPIATYPAMSFRSVIDASGKRNPVKVKWTNNLPDNHLFCPQPANRDVPCGIDRTLMGVTGAPVYVSGNMVGTGQSPDNAVVIHLHGGEIPPDADGFAELWIGNTATSTAYTRAAEPLQQYDPLNPLGATVASTTVASNIDPPFVPPLGNAIPADNAYPGAPLDQTDTSGPTMWDPAAGDPTKLSILKYQTGQLLRPVGNSVVYNYPMVQQPATIWYHDHALGKTRVNVVAGPAGFFIIDGGPAEDAALAFSRGDCSTTGVLAGLCFEIPLAFQDRAFNHDGTINFPNGLGQVTPGVANPNEPGPNPTVHPQWVPEYFGDHSVVNGVIWPNLKVAQRPYRFRMLDGSNARCYTFGLKAPGKIVPPMFNIIGTDQGLMRKQTTVAGFTLCPGERQDVIIDFSAMPLGTKIQVTNTAGAPYPAGPTPQQAKSPFAQMATLMQFEVTTIPGVVAATWKPPKVDFGVKPALPAPVVTRQFVLNEVLDPLTLAPLRVEIDGKAFEEPVSETPKRGTVERWNIVNTTVDAHPMHLHLVKFKVVSRQTVDVNKLSKAIGLPVANPYAPTFPQLNLNYVLANFLMGAPRPPDLNEGGWKDTAKALPGEVLTIDAMWDGTWQDKPVVDPTTGQFDSTKPFWEPVTSGPYVWHCHIVDHEDNQMMRPTLVMP